MTKDKTVTMSRELVQRWVDNTDFFEDLRGKSMTEINEAKKEDEKITEELRAILAAPVVERQPEPVAYLDIGAGGYMDLGSDLTDEQLQALPNGRHMLGILGTFGVDGWEPALIFSAGKTDPVAYATFYDCGDIKVWSRSAKVVEDIVRHGEKAIPLYTSPPELAELQATIAMQREKLDAQEAEIERLKCGQGEPVAWQYMTHPTWDKGAWPTEWTDCTKEAHDDYVRAPLIADWEYRTRKLFASPPAPVAVLHFLCDRIPDQNGCTFIECENSEGSSINAGEWVVRPDGLAQLVVSRPPLKLPEYKRPPPGCVITQEMAAHNACLDKVKELNQ